MLFQGIFERLVSLFLIAGRSSARHVSNSVIRCSLSGSNTVIPQKLFAQSYRTGHTMVMSNRDHLLALPALAAFGRQVGSSLGSAPYDLPPSRRHEWRGMGKRGADTAVIS